MTEDERYTDEELLESVVGHPNLSEMMDAPEHAWAMGASWANAHLLMGSVLQSIHRERELGADVTDEELANAVFRRLDRHFALEHRAKERRDAVASAQIDAWMESERLEREADPAKMAAYEAEWDQIQADMEAFKAGTVEADTFDLVAELRGVRADGQGHRMALEELEREDAYRRRRVNLVEDWLAERLPRDQCPPWAAEIFAAARR